MHPQPLICVEDVEASSRWYHRNPPAGDGGPNHWEIWLRDPDGYTVVLASPDGSADGNWKP
jgi:hypothetical protein